MDLRAFTFFLAVAQLLFVLPAWAQMNTGIPVPAGGLPITNSLLNELRAIQFPPVGNAPSALPAHAQGGVASANVGVFGTVCPGGMGSASVMARMEGQIAGSPLGTPMTAIPSNPAPRAGGQTAPEPPADLACSYGPRGFAWDGAKQRFRSLFAQSALPMQLLSREAMVATMEGALRDLKAVNAFAPENAQECGLGKLCLQLLSFAAIDDPSVLLQLFAGFEQLSSPVLTMMLEVPWAGLAQSGWSFFGLLAQINLRKGHVTGALNNDVLDGLDAPAAREFHARLGPALISGDQGAMEKASATFLQQDVKGSPLGPLTAMATQASTAKKHERTAALQGLQVVFKQVIGSATELDLALATHWPLWGIVHAVVDGLFA